MFAIYSVGSTVVMMVGVGRQGYDVCGQWIRQRRGLQRREQQRNNGQKPLFI